MGNEEVGSRNAATHDELAGGRIAAAVACFLDLLAGVEQVAALAGMSCGAIYGNFKDRDELFMAVLESRWHPIIPPFKTGATLKEQMRCLADAVIAAAPARQAMALRALEFQIYALTHPQMQAKLERYSAEGYRLAEQGLLRFIAAEDLPIPPAHFVRLLNALTEGLLFERFQAPREITDEVIRSAFDALAACAAAR